METKTYDVMRQNAVLLLEGGSLRGLYTAGALDVFMEQGVWFPAVAGVSAGALNAINYVSRQQGRSASINLRYRHDDRYFGARAVAESGSVFGLNFLVRGVNDEVPFDADAFWHGGQKLYAVATCLQTGRAAVFDRDLPGIDFMDAVRASASLPLLTVPVKLGGKSYLDGGCACAIPLKWALDHGYERIVVVTTRQRGFRKPLPARRMVELYSDFYSRYPLFLDRLLTQSAQYNALMDRLDALEDAGRVFALRPQAPVEIGRFEGNTEALLDLYNRGRRETRARMDALREYLGE